MDQLRQSDIRLLLDFTRDCNEPRAADSFDHFIRNLVAALARLIPAGHVTYNEMHPQESKSYSWVNTLELSSPEANRLWEQHMNEHPVMRHVLATNDRRAVRISDFWSSGELHDHGLYWDFYRLYAIEDALCITIPCPLPAIIGAGWHRDQPFTDREVLLADLVRPHISQAWENAHLRSAMWDHLHLLNRGLDDAPEGAIACDPEGHVHFMTAKARSYLVEYFGVPNLGHHLPEELQRWLANQTAQLCEDELPPLRLPLVVARGDKRLKVRLLSNGGAPHTAFAGASDCANLLLLEKEVDPEPRAAFGLPPHAAAAEKFGLSPRECEVLTWVARGKANGDIATILDTKPATVRKHLEHIFQKLGVETRTAAAVIVLQNPTAE